MKILHVIPSLSPRRGGASKAAIDMVLALNQAGAIAEIACTNDHELDTLNVPLNRLTQFCGVPVRFFKRSTCAIKPITEFSYSHTFKQWFDQHASRYDLIHVHGLFSFTSTYSMMKARRHAIPYVAHPIGMLDTWSLRQARIKKWIYLILFEKNNLRGAAAVHFTAESEKEQALCAVSGIKSMTIPLGLTPQSLKADSKRKLHDLYQIQDTDLVLLYLGRIHPKKGLEKTLEAMALNAEAPIALIIAGEASQQYAKQLKHQVEILGLANKCLFVGWVSGQQKQILLQGADLFVLNSSSENFGLVALEASASATPVLLSHGVALSKQAVEYKFGFACTSDAQAISIQLMACLNEREMLREYGQNGRDYVLKHHNWQNLAAQLLRKYAEITRKGRHSLVE